MLLMVLQKQQNEYDLLQENMSEVWLQATKVHEVNKALKKQSLKKTLYLKDTN